MNSPAMARRWGRHWRVMTLVAGLTFAMASTSSAAPCAGFTDVDDASGFCPSVEWLKNRRITLGCASATVYCPSQPVIRLAMAAFMNRLGTALTPFHLPVDDAPGALDLDTGIVVCQTEEFAVVDFPRRAYADVSFNGRATTDVGFAADLVMTSDGGANWTKLNATANRGVVMANRWGGFTDLGFADLAVGQNLRWGVRLSRAGIPGTAGLADSRCALRVLIYSRNGDASPF